MAVAVVATPRSLANLGSPTEASAAASSEIVSRARGSGILVGVAPDSRSARLEDVLAGGGATPVAIRIDRFGVFAQVDGVGVDPTSGELAVPSTATRAAWYRSGPTPGSEGSAVIAAHVDFNGKAGVFFHLADLVAGDTISVDLSDGTARTFVVSDLSEYAKADLPIGPLFDQLGPPRLSLVTCGGEFHSKSRSYADNVLVTALPQ